MLTGGGDAMTRKQVICYIQAFDCEETVEAAMRSVLNQTYNNWRCFVLSNGNKHANQVLNIIKKVASEDNRFVVLNKQHNLLDMYPFMLLHLAGLFPDSYICSLDSDDEYKPDFFERAVTFAEEHKLDVVACGTEIFLKQSVDDEEKTLTSRRELKENLIVRRAEYTLKFPLYKSFFNEIWGKLYNTDILRDKSYFNEKFLRKNIFLEFLPDSRFEINVLSKCDALGVLSGTSHRFFQFVKRKPTNATLISNTAAASRVQVFRVFRKQQRFSVYSTYNVFMDFLRENGETDDSLYEYMQAVLFGWFEDFYGRIILETTAPGKIVKYAWDIVFNDKFDELMMYKDSGKYNNLRNFEKRKEFVDKLRFFLSCQEEMRNGWLHLPVKLKLNKIIDKLEQIGKLLSDLQAVTPRC
jgi:hypothetical protein